MDEHERHDVADRGVTLGSLMTRCTRAKYSWRPTPAGPRGSVSRPACPRSRAAPGLAR